MDEAKIWSILNDSRALMTNRQKHLWDIIRIIPQNWHAHYPQAGGLNQYWVVALFGQTTIWYDNHEGGFRRSSFEVFGQIGECMTGEQELSMAVQEILNAMNGAFAAP